MSNKNMMPDTPKKKSLQLMIHILGWGIVFGIPLFFFERNSTADYIDHYLRFISAPVSLMIIFYFNYCYLIDKFLFRKQTREYLLSNIVLIAFVTLCLHLWHELHIPGATPPPNPPRHFPIKRLDGILFFLTRDIIPLILATGMSVAIKMTSRWIQSENEIRELEKSRTEAELRNLRNQLNPHFLFNTLNNIYSLIALSPEKAQQAIMDLSKLLRYVLYENSPDFVPLQKEMEFVRNYVELMRLRLTDNTDIKISLPEQTNSGILIAPLLFISLIENAFKHGVCNSHPSFIYIDITECSDQRIVCTIENSYFPKNETDKSGSGIGLDNLRKRLDLLYPGHYLLNIKHTDNKYISALILFTHTEEE